MRLSQRLPVDRERPHLQSSLALNKLIHLKPAFQALFELVGVLVLVLPAVGRNHTLQVSHGALESVLGILHDVLAAKDARRLSVLRLFPIHHIQLISKQKQRAVAVAPDAA